MTPKSWALTDSAADVLELMLSELRPTLALEFGSGRSTLLLRKYARRTVSLEHHPDWWERTATTVDGGGDDLVLAPIVEVPTPAGPLPSYDADIPDDVDFVLIDGPPGSIGRTGTLFAAWPHLSEDATIVLDDWRRDGEREAVEIWRRHLPIMVRAISPHLLLITRSSR